MQAKHLIWVWLFHDESKRDRSDWVLGSDLPSEVGKPWDIAKIT